MGVSIRKTTLSSRRQKLVELMQELNFGTIERLVVHEGDPVFRPPPLVSRQVKLGSGARSRPESCLTDFALKDSVRELFSHFDRIGNGMIQRLDVRNGLPFTIVVEESAA